VIATISSSAAPTAEAESVQLQTTAILLVHFYRWYRGWQ